jgi:hypothetical protein
MGWTFFHKPVGMKAVDTIKREFGEKFCAEKLVAATATREAVFMVVKVHEPDSDVYVPDADGTIRTLAVIAIKSSRGQYNFGYKDMTETMGPYGLEAPLSIIAQCSALRDPIGPQPEYSSLRSATEYRARSARVAAIKALKRKLKPGTKVTLPEALSFGGIMQQAFTVDRARVRGNKTPSTVFRADNGMLCRITAKQLEGARIEEIA